MDWIHMAAMAIVLGLVGCTGDGGDAGDSGDTAGDTGSTTSPVTTSAATDGSTSVVSVGASSGGMDDASTGGSSSGDGGGGSGNQCAVDADCPDGGPCVELAPGGLTVCIGPINEATKCGPDKLDECCITEECTEGLCVPNWSFPSCSGVNPGIFNVCAVDACRSNADCPADGACIPAGALGFPVATCVAAACLSDADCTDSAGGQCVLEPTTTCCNDVQPRCRYPETPPLSDKCPP